MLNFANINKPCCDEINKNIKIKRRTNRSLRHTSFHHNQITFEAKHRFNLRTVKKDILEVKNGSRKP